MATAEAAIPIRCAQLFRCSRLPYCETIPDLLLHITKRRSVGRIRPFGREVLFHTRRLSGARRCYARSKNSPGDRRIGCIGSGKQTSNLCRRTNAGSSRIAGQRSPVLLGTGLRAVRRSNGNGPPVLSGRPCREMQKWKRNKTPPPGPTEENPTLCLASFKIIGSDNGTPQVLHVIHRRGSCHNQVHLRQD